MRSNPPPSLESATNRLPIVIDSPYGKEASVGPISEMTLFTMETWMILCLVNSEINRRSLPNPQMATGSRTGVFSGRVGILLRQIYSRSAFVLHPLRQATIAFFWSPAVGFCLASRAGRNWEIFMLLGLKNIEGLSGRYATLLLLICQLFRLQVISSTSRFAYIEVVSPAQPSRVGLSQFDRRKKNTEERKIGS